MEKQCLSCGGLFEDKGIYTYCNKCGTITGRVFTDAILVISFAIIMTTIMLLSFAGIINQWFASIPIGIFALLVMMIVILTCTKFGYKICKKYPNIFTQHTP